MGIFKTYDIRGVYPSELNEKIAFEIGRTLVSFFRLRRVCVGYDTRLSSEKLFKALTEGIISQGADAVNIGLCSTPLFLFAVPFYRYEFGIMITASHNPKEYNGFKIADNRTFNDVKTIGYDNGLKKIEEIMAKAGVPAYAGRKGAITAKDAKQDYIDHLLKFAPKEGLKKMKIAVDASNGMGSIAVKEVFEQLGIKLVPLSFEMDGNFPDHGPNPSLPGSLKKLEKEVKKQKADFGVAFDSDADRAIFVDDTGKQIPAEFVLILLAKALAKSKNDIIIYDLTSSWIVKEEILMFAMPVMSKVGQVFIKEKMKDVGAILAGEVSGHYTFKDNYYGDSGIVAVLLMIKYLSSEKKKLSVLVKPFRKYSKSEGLSYQVKDKEAKMKELSSKYKDATKMLFLDGFTAEYKDWWFNARPSNTEPILRLVVEAKTKKALTAKVKELEKIIKK